MTCLNHNIEIGGGYVPKTVPALCKSNSQFEYAVSLIGQCTEDYLFYFNITRDYYSISSEAVKKFAFPDSIFSNATEIIMNIVYPEDREKLSLDVTDLKERKKTEHNLEYRWIDRNGNIVWISCRGMIANLDECNDELVLVGRISEIGTDKKADNITGLKMDNQIYHDFSKLVPDGSSHNGCMMMIGIDNLKQINDVHGTEIVHDILKSLADCISRLKESSTYLYRIDGSGFLLVDYDNGNILKSKNLYNTIRNYISQLTSSFEYKAIYTISAGIAEFTESDAPEDILHKAEFSLHQAKRNGRNCAFIFDLDTYNTYIRKLDICECLRQSVNASYKGFEVFYQPVINPDNNRVCGSEALLRWKNDTYQNVYPSEFIPILEESGLIIPVGRWVFETAIAQCREWQKVIPDFKMHINLSYVQILKSNVVDEIIDCIDQNHVNPETIIFEFTESGQIESDSKIKRLINNFNERGIGMAIDDFGTGYSNLVYLHNMKVNTLKIDRTFVANALKTDFDFTLITNVVNMAHDINLDVCLEGIETEHEREKLDELHPDFIQGYLYGRPCNSREFTEKYINTYKK